MLHLETLDTRTLEILRLLLVSDIFSEARLVGGTALALQLGHRKSVDIDLFGSIDAATEDITELCSLIGETIMLSNSRNIKAFMLEGIKVDAVNYRFKWLEDAIIQEDIRMASLKDIAAMKVAAIVNRGTKKDFIDIFYLLKHFTLKEILGLYCDKYPEGSIFIVLKSMAYFDDAESDPMPYMFDDVQWTEIKEYISKEVISYGYEY